MLRCLCCTHVTTVMQGSVADKALVIPLPPQCDAPLPETAGAFLKLREKADRVAFIALPEIKPTFRP